MHGEQRARRLFRGRAVAHAAIETPYHFLCQQHAWRQGAALAAVREVEHRVTLPQHRRPVPVAALRDDVAAQVVVIGVPEAIEGDARHRRRAYFAVPTPATLCALGGASLSGLSELIEL